MADDQTQQLAPNDPWAVKAQQLLSQPPPPAQTDQQANPLQSAQQQLDPNDPWAVKARQLQGQQQQSSSTDPWATKAKQLGFGSPDQQEADEAERLGTNQTAWTRPLTTTLWDLPEYRKGAGPIERGVEKFASGLTTPLSVGLIVATGGLGGLAEAGAATAAGEEASLGLAGRVGAKVLSTLPAETAATVAKVASSASKLANFGFTAQQIVGVADRVPEFAQALKDGDYDRAQEVGTTALLEGLAAKMSASHLADTMSGDGKPTWTADKDIIAESQQPQREYGAKALQFRKANTELIKNKPLDMAAMLYHEAGGDPTVLEQWRREIVDDNNIKTGVQSKYDNLLKLAQNLPPEVQQLSAKIRTDYASDLDELKRLRKFNPNSPGQPNYAGQHRYVADDEGGSNLQYVGNRVTKSPGFVKTRSYDTIVDAVKAGYAPQDIGLSGAREQYIRDFGRLVGAVNAEEAGLKTKVADSRPLFVDPAKYTEIDGKRVIPLPGDAEVGAVGERRSDLETRKRIDQMTPDEMRKALLTSEVTGLPNRRAFNESSSPAVAMSDADGLKAFNDKYGYAAGDALLRAKADALREAGIDAYHEKGDEFLYRGDNTPELAHKLEIAKQLLRDKVIEVTEPDGSVTHLKGVDFSYGTGLRLEDAEKELKADKAAREQAGLRTRGGLGSITEVPQGQQVPSVKSGGSGSAPEEITGKVRPEDALRRTVGSLDPAEIKAAVMKEGATDLQIQNLRDACKAGQKIEPVEVTLDKSGRVVGSEGLPRAYAAMQAGIERVPFVMRRLADDAEPGDVIGKWPNGLDPITDKEIIGRAQAEITGSSGENFESLSKADQRKIVKRALDMKVEERTKNAAGPTAVRNPSLQSQGDLKVIAKNGKLYLDISDYKEGPDVFKRHRYLTEDKYGNPVWKRMNVLVHPDYVDAVNKAFDDKSWFRQAPILRNLLRGSTIAKKSLLSFSPFHFTTEYLRGLQMGLSPREALSPPEVTPDRLSVRAKFGPVSGLEGQQSQALAEGLASNNNILHKIPGVGKFLESNEERLFGGGGYIDRLKSASFDKVVDQLSKRHTNWTEDQVHFAASRIVDAAFGGLNWKMLGVSMNGVDALRTLMLAPDFTGSQVLFGKYGFEPGGSIVTQSLGRIALYNFGVARVLNMLTTGSPQLDHPFSVVSPDGSKEYSVRTMPADLLHAIRDPRGFTYNRLNPLLMRTAVEGATGRDDQGRRVTYQRELTDLLRNVLPIPSSTAIKLANKALPAGSQIPDIGRSDEGLVDSALRSAGVAPEPNVSTAYKLSQKIASDHNETGPLDQDRMQRHQFVMQMEDAMRSGTLKGEDLNDAIRNGTLARDEAKQIYENFKETSQGQPGKDGKPQPMNEYQARLYTRAKRLGMPDFFQVWDVATPAEKKLLEPLLFRKGKEYLMKSQKSKPPSELQKDATYNRLWNDLRHMPLW
jgi:GGDEF domain-containing protein